MNETKAKIRVILADDHAIVRKGIREFLEDDPEIAVVGEGSDGEEALRLAGEHVPNVAVLDIQMPGMTGIEATRRIKASHPGIRVLIFTAYEDDPYVFALLRAGADSFILKNASPDELVRAVKATAAGGTALSPGVAAKVVAQMATGRPAAAQEQIEPLSKRELDVLRLAGQGHTNKAIGLELGISDRTVQGHLANIYGKLGVSSRMRRLRGLRAQLLLWTILPLAAALTVLSVAGITSHRQAMTDLVMDRDRSLTLASANRLSREIDRRVADLAVAAAAPGLASDTVQLAGMAATLQEAYPGGITLLDAMGRPAATEEATSAWASREEARVLAARTAAVGAPQFEGLFDAAPASSQTLLVGAPAGDGRVLIGAIPTETLPLAGMDHVGAFFIFDATGRRIHHSEHGGAAPDPAELSDLPPPPPGGAGAATLHGPGGQQLVVTYARIEPPGWMFVAAEDVRAMAAMDISFVEILPGVLLFVALLGLLAVSFGVANVLRPLHELDRRAARLAWGDFDAVKEPVGGVQEMEDLRATLAQMAERIRTYQTGMRDYLSAVTQAQEEERTRLARELHDDTVQSLIALKQRAQMARKVLGSDPRRADERLVELEGLIDHELGALRQLIGDLRPIYLEDLGFVPALEMLARRMETPGGLTVT